MVASRIAALIHPTTLMSELIFRLSIWTKSRPPPPKDSGSAQEVNNEGDDENRSK
jgi:hypothetical protein